ncbi:MAG TPA: hypothetical protein VJV78_37160 [Polyangiales bacterium]|nr:hypothetical protein [Polyangiales bacterium]
MGLLSLLVGCDPYDAGKIEDAGSGGGGGGKGGGGAGSAGKPPTPCVPSEEICNDKDDDCNGTVDDEVPASEDCSRRYHAKVACGRGGFCLFVPANPMCDPGYYHCDGLPETGCESTTPCACMGCAGDGGSEDAGADDAG